LNLEAVFFFPLLVFFPSLPLWLRCIFSSFPNTYLHLLMCIGIFISLFYLLHLLKSIGV
jgi:hypothetical protein